MNTCWLASHYNIAQDLLKISVLEGFGIIESQAVIENIMSLSTANGSGDAGHRMNDLGQRSLCNACDKFDLYSFNRDPFGFRGYKYSDVEKAAASGCTFCSLLEGAFKNKMRGASQSFPSGWERQWWIHLSIQGYSRPRDLESGDAGLQIRALEATIATEDYTLPRRIHGVKVTWATYSKAFASVLLHIAADSGK